MDPKGLRRGAWWTRVAIGTLLAASGVHAVAQASKPAPAEPAHKATADRFPAANDPEWRPEFDDLEKAGLPTDVPPPPKTAFVDAHYLRGYRSGLACALLMSSRTGDSDDWDSPSVQRGWLDGQDFGKRVRARRQAGDSERRYGFYRNGKVVDDTSPADERAVLAEFLAFADRFERALRAGLPDSVTIEIPGARRLYSHEYDDYSHDNTGEPRRVRQLVGSLDAQKPGNLQWMRVTPKPGREDDAAARGMAGEYGFKFDHDAATGRWSLMQDPDSPHRAEGDFSHMQPLGPHRWRLPASSPARAIVLRAIADAQPALVPAGEIRQGGPWLLRIATPWATAVALSGDGSRVATESENRVQVWDVATAAPVGPAIERTRVGHLALSPDGTRLAVSGYADDAIVYDVATGKPLMTLSTGSLEFVPPAPPSGVAAATSRASITSLEFNAAGTTLLTAGDDAAVRIWDAGTGKLYRSVLNGDRVYWARFAGDGSHVVAAAGSDLRLYGVDDGRRLFSVRQRWSSRLGMASAGDRMIVVSGGVEAIDVATGKATLLAAIPAGLKGGGYATAVSDANRHRIVLVGPRAAYWIDTRAADGATWRETPHERPILVPQAVTSPDGRFLAVFGNRSAAGVWDAATGARVLDLGGKYIYGDDERPDVVFSRDGRRVAVSYPREGQTIVWDVPR